MDERPPLPRAPMVPGLRTDVPPARPLRPDSSPGDGEPSGGERDHDRDSDRDRDRRPRRRRRSSSSRSSGDDRMRRDPERGPDDPGRAVEQPTDPYETDDRPAQVDRYSPSDRPASVDRYASPEPSEPIDRFAPSDRFASSEPPAAAERRGPPDHAAATPPVDLPDRAPRDSRGPSAETGPLDEPLDMLSGFGEREEPASAPAQAASFGRHRRPWTQHRKGRQSKPRDAKTRHGLGTDLNREQEAANPPAQPFGRPSPSEDRKGEGKIGLTGGIGPIDLDEGKSEGFRPEES